MERACKSVLFWKSPWLTLPTNSNTFSLGLGFKETAQASVFLMLLGTRRSLSDWTTARSLTARPLPYAEMCVDSKGAAIQEVLQHQHRQVTSHWLPRLQKICANEALSPAHIMVVIG